MQQTIQRDPGSHSTRLEDLPNIGRHIAGDLRAIGITSPAELRARKPMAVFRQLEHTMGHRHDPCVLYTLLAVNHYLTTAETLPWWRFTLEGKTMLSRESTKF